MLRKHPQAGLLPFLLRTVAAQIHIVALLGSIVGTVLLVEKSMRLSLPDHFIAPLIFGVTSIFLFTVSSLYHFLSDGFQMSKPLEGSFEKLDHIAIFLFISGTYTPVLLNAVSPPWTNILLVFMWTLALLGTLYTLFKHRLPAWAQHRYTYTALYVLMGLVFVVRINEILHTLSSEAFRYLILGGVSYVMGAVVYAIRWPNLIKGVFGFHELWHCLVVVGYVSHYLLIYGFYV